MSIATQTCAMRSGQCAFPDECTGRHCRAIPDTTLEPPPKETHVIAGETILEEAARLTTEDRNHTYGPFTAESQKIAKGWSLILGIDVPPDRVALCMIWMKIARLTNKMDHRDGWVDIAGFASIGYQAAKEAAP